MMAPYDGSGVPQQGQPGGVGQPMQRGPMPPGHVPGNPSPVMHQHPMNPAYGHQHRNGGMPGQAPYHPGGMQSQSPGRPGSFSGMPGGAQGYGAHPSMHSPHQSVQGPPHMQPPMQRPGQQMHRGSIGPHNGGMMGQPGMPPPPNMQQHHDAMRAQGGMPPNQQHYMQQNSQRQPSNNNVMSGNWQSEKDTPHRREMIQHM